MDDKEELYNKEYYDSEDFDHEIARYKESDFIPLDDLGYAPLHALEVSNQKLRSQVIETIKSMGTPCKKETEEIIQLNNVNIAFEQLRTEGEDGYSIDNLQMKVPLLSIIPITNLNVEKAEISFSTEVKVEKKEGKSAITARICSQEQRESDFFATYYI